MEHEISYQQSFQDGIQRAFEAVSRIAQGLSDWEAALEMEDCVYVKNEERVIIFDNAAYRKFFVSGDCPLGREGDAYLDKSILEASLHSDAMVFSGVSELTCRHHGRGPDGATYLLETHKRSLRELNSPGLALLGVTRPLQRISDPKAGLRLQLEEQFKVFRQFDPRDKMICQQTALGLASREIAEQLGLSRRAVESHKHKAYGKLGIGKTAELIRMLVRFQDQGFADLGL